MISVLIWYLLITVIGFCCLPLAFRLFGALPDRGYTLARPLGLLLGSYLFWLLGSFGVLQNDSGGVLMAFLILVLINLALLRGKLTELRAFFNQQRRLVLVAEILFALAFAAWAFVRSANPEITYTEKPMELAFLNSILRSPGIPPNDPWLSGYAISYYYFGYIMVSALIRLSGVSTAVGFNLAISLCFALTALAAYGILFNLLAIRWKREEENSRSVISSAAGWALLAPLFILIVSNMAGFLDILHARGLFWTQMPDGNWTSGFWTWLGIKDFNVPPPQPFGWVPARGGWMWWRGSRVLQDFNLLGGAEEVIDEFPFFSYLLADLHPHVLAMPFVLLAIGLALNFYIHGSLNGYEKLNIAPLLLNFKFWLTALLLGALAFLNTWDFPFYVALYSAVFVLIGFRQAGWEAQRLWDFLGMSMLLGIAGILLYLPFYIGFASQAGGILPSLIYFTRGANFWVMFAPLLIPILGWLIFLAARNRLRKELKEGFLFAAALVASLWLLMVIFGVLIQLVASVGQGTLASAASMLFAKMGGSGSDLFSGLMLARLKSPGAWLTLLILLGLTWASFLAIRSRYREMSLTPESNQAIKIEDAGLRANGFVLLLVLVGIGLALFPEFFYLRDQFGTRMNTIFKFYFQVWILWGLAAAYASTELWRRLRGWGGAVFRLGWAVLILMALCYPAVMLPYKMGMPGKAVSELTLDGIDYLRKYDADELAAYQWLAQSPYGVVSEAIGGSYQTEFARVSAHTGLPTVLGWGGHEAQWRGGSEEMGSRDPDIAALYQTRDWNEAKSIINRYQIRYIYIGPSELRTYRVEEAKFAANLVRVFKNSSVVIYEVPWAIEWSQD